MHGAWRLVAVFVCAAFAVAGAVDAAYAGTASGRPAKFVANAGEQNDLTVLAGGGGQVQFTDSVSPIGALLPWCIPFPLGQALCDPDGDPRDTDGGGVVVELGDRDDRGVIRFIPGTATRPGRISVGGGAGDDIVENVASGSVRIDGGAGDDRLDSVRAAGAYLLGGPGADVLRSSGECCAVAGYSDHGESGVGITLDGVANDGFAGEQDDVRTNHVIGSRGGDTITGGGQADTLVGGGGADVIDGRGGDDTINATLDYAQSFESPGSVDRADTVSCGAGDDEVMADENDDVAVDCERIRLGFPVAPEIVLATKSARADRQGVVRLTFRVKTPNPGNAATARSTVRLVDRGGLAASSTTRFTLGAGANLVRLRVTLNKATRTRLLKARAGSVALVVQRVSRSGDGGPAAGHEQVHVPLRVARPAAEPAVPA
jgi:Ca2+-binding RTX toxin-like protein